MLKLTPPLQLTATEPHHFMPGGVTSPMFVVATDKSDEPHNVILKFRNPSTPVGHGHYGSTSLACELICSILARALGLPVPDYAIVDVRPRFWEYLKGEKTREIFRKNVGENFGTLYHEGFLLWNQADYNTKDKSILELCENVLSFDSAVYNPDREQDRPNLLISGQEMLLIDHSLALPAHKWNDGASPILEDSKVQKHCVYPAVRNKRYQYTKIFDLWLKNNKTINFDELRSFIPRSWETTRGDLDKLIRFLKNRSGKFVTMSQSLRSSVG